MPRFFVSALIVAACLSTPAWSATRCPEHFAAGIAPVVTNARLQPRTQEICFAAYAVLHSGISRTSLYSAEHLTRVHVQAAEILPRIDSFHPEPALPAQDRAELTDYARSGYDRGHMSPNGDMPDRFSQAQSFSLANMAPQVHASNAGVWEGIEGAARRLALSEGDLYVVSGPAFIGSKTRRIGRVLVPTHFWKVLYSPAQQRAGAYVTANDATRSYSTLTVSGLEKMVGLKLLPGLSQTVRDAGMSLPRPIAEHPCQRSRGLGQEEFRLRPLPRLLLNTIRSAGHP